MQSRPSPPSPPLCLSTQADVLQRPRRGHALKDAIPHRRRPLLSPECASPSSGVVVGLGADDASSAAAAPAATSPGPQLASWDGHVGHGSQPGHSPGHPVGQAVRQLSRQGAVEGLGCRLGFGAEVLTSTMMIKLDPEPASHAFPIQVMPQL